MDAFRGDTGFLKARHDELDRFGRGVMLLAFAKALVAAAPPEAPFYQDDVEDMLKVHAVDSRAPTDFVDIRLLVESFERARAAEGLVAERYSDGKGPDRHSEGKSITSNPLLPGHSQT